MKIMDLTFQPLIFSLLYFFLGNKHTLGLEGNDAIASIFFLESTVEKLCCSSGEKPSNLFRYLLESSSTVYVRVSKLPKETTVC